MKVFKERKEEEHLPGAWYVPSTGCFDDSAPRRLLRRRAETKYEPRGLRDLSKLASEEQKCNPGFMWIQSPHFYIL